MKDFLNKMKMYIKRHSIICIIMLFIILPLLLNIGIYITDVLYDKFGWTLTASGLGNKDWFEFLGAYVSVVIVFVGICLTWKSSVEDRKMGKNEKLAQAYDEDLKEEKDILIEVCQSFNTEIIYKAINELDNMDTRECKRILQNSREKIFDVQVKFELLSDIADGFQKCEGCKFNPCYDRENMIAVRDLYYKMGSIYLEMLHDCVIYVDKMEQQQRNEEIIQNEERLIFSLQQQIDRDKNMVTPGFCKNIKGMEEEILRYRDNVEILKGQRLGSEEAKKMADPIIEKINLISQEMKPQLISYCKSYMGWKSRHKKELLLEGKIQYLKYPGCNEKN